MNLRENIRRALRTPCNYDFLAVHRVIMAEHSWPAHRPVYARLQNLLKLLTSGGGFNQSRLAKECSCSVKTIQRDIEFLRAQGIQLSYDKAAFLYQLNPGQNHPWLKTQLEAR